jgi:hypothetical protein
VATLSWSRHQYVEFVFDQKIDTWLRCHRNAFEYFGGVPKQVLGDNQKSAVLEHRVGTLVRFNERVLDLALRYGLTPRACCPHRARTKGKDERMVGYIKGNFFVRYRSFESWTHLNRLAERWLAEEANPPKLLYEIDTMSGGEIHGEGKMSYSSTSYRRITKIGMARKVKLCGFPTVPHVFDSQDNYDVKKKAIERIN